MTPTLLDAIAEVCKWHGIVISEHPPMDIAHAIRTGEIPVPEELRTMILEAVVGKRTLVNLPDDWHTEGT